MTTIHNVYTIRGTLRRVAFLDQPVYMYSATIVGGKDLQPTRVPHAYSDKLVKVTFSLCHVLDQPVYIQLPTSL